ncbi:MAG: biopolymer transporter ExbD [Myxococcales bacterium]|nr:biopolymer transporter ExbD [Myxococcales bacterium]
MVSARRAANRRRLRRRREVAHARASGDGGPKSEINVTPFVDVVLVLLIIFMVVTPMLQRGVDVLLPVSINHREQKDTGEQIIVSVKQSGVIYLGRDALTEGQLAQRLAPLLTRQPPPPIFVKGDRRLDWKTIRRVLEIVKGAGAPGVALATEGKGGGKK